MSSLAPLLTPLSKKQRGKAKKYIAVDQIPGGISPYRSLAKAHSWKKRTKKEAGGGNGRREVNSKLCYQYEEALRRRDFRQVLWMITNGDIPSNYETKTGETALLAAVSAKNLDALAMLMTSGVSIDTPNRRGYTPLMKAIAVVVPQHRPVSKRVSDISVLSNNNVEELGYPSASMSDFSTGIYDNDIVASVLDYEPNLIQMDQSGRTAFDWAKLTGNTQALEWLETRQREKSVKRQSLANRQERVAQCQELLSRHEECIQRIESLIAPQFFDENELVKSLKMTTTTATEFTRASNDLKAMDDTPRPLPFRSQFFVNTETREGWTPLTKCAAFGYVVGVQELLAMGADFRYETRLRHTAMTWASYCGHEAVVLHLLRVGVDVNQKTRDGKTALMHAISNSQAKIVHHLLIATRDECFPANAIESFSTEVDPNLQCQSKIKTRISAQKTKELKSVELEWHKTFLKKMKWQDQTGKDALKLAQCAVEQTQAVYDGLQDESSSDRQNEVPPAIQVLRQVQNAIKEAEEHKKYVEVHAERTKLTTCHSDGCSFVAPKDVLPTHEQHHCPKRMIKCDNCDATLIFEDRIRHDAQMCPMRRVKCTNFQYGCQEQILFKDREHHLNHHCRKRAIECRLLCGATVHFDELDEHESAQCSLRIVSCDQGCQAKFAANFSKNHRLHECPKRMVPCTGKSLVNGGCRERVKYDEMDFHLSTLCELRELSCKWASYGCDEKIAGVAGARYNHETHECPFRLVSCRNGCELSGQVLACFAEEHYRWQCMLERKPCLNECGDKLTGEVLQLPRHLMMVHVLQDAGDCPLRKTHCPLDLCGKHIRLLDTNPRCHDHVKSGNGGYDKVEIRPTCLKAMQQHINVYEAFLNKLHSSQQQFSSDETEEKVDRGFEKGGTVTFLVNWLQGLFAKLQQKYTELKLRKDTSSQVCRILTFDPRKSQHLLEFPDGHSVWMSLELRGYDIVLPKDADAMESCLQYFRCGLLPVQTLGPHIDEDCCHRLAPCPLDCGQRLPAHTVEFHLAKRCNMRNAVCRLGCGEIMAFGFLSEHESDHCEFRFVFCEYCHLSLSVKTMDVHLDKECQQLPRGCRLGCAYKVAWANTKEHESSRCPKRLIKCRICEDDIWFCDRECHEKDECPLRLYGKCDDGCGEILRYNEIAHHLLFSCMKRIVDCKQCRRRLLFDSLQEHHELLCSQRVVNCPKGCGIRIKEVDTDIHESEECSKRLVFCENQCGLHVPYCEMEEHLKSKCTMRVMMCPTGCRELVFSYLYEDHWERCRQRVVPCGVGGKMCARPIRVWHVGNKLVRCAVHNANALLWALKSQDLDLATYLLQNVDAFNVVNEEFANGFSPLVLAASLGNLDLIHLLLRFGADVNLETSRGRTPLAEACMAQDVAIVKLLIDNRASVTHTNRQGRNLLEMAHAFADSETSTSETSDKVSKWKEIIHLLEEQEELERTQRDLFIAITCSNYDHLIQCFKYSAKAPSHTLPANPLEALHELVNAKEKQSRAVRAELDEAIHVFNESIAETEVKRVQAIQLSSQVDDSCRRLQNVEKAEEASDIDSSALEADMLAMIRQITAQDIAQLLNSHVPSDTSLVVVKALSLLCGVVPRGRRNATEYTDVEWWKTAQALLMDRSLLRQLRGYRQQTISPDVMAKVRRECLKTPAFAVCSAEFKANCASFNTESGERSMNSRIPPVETLRGNIIGIIATWVQGVELEYKARAERQVFVERKRQLEVALTVAREKQQHSSFEAQVGARSLPARQEEVEAVRIQNDIAEKELEVAKKRLNTYKLLNYAALSGHTPLTFACAVGNEAIVHMLISHGACSGHQFEEQNLCASFIQALVRDFQYRKKFERQRRVQELSGGGAKPRSDAATEALVRNVAHSFIVGHYKRKLVHFRQTHRVAIHEAIINGYPEIAAILLSKEARLWQNTYVLPERVYPGSLLENIGPISKESQEMVKRQGKWKLQPLATERKKTQYFEEDTDEIDFGKPMTVAETLNCALKYFDSRLFNASKGWGSDETVYSATAEFVNNSLEKMENSRQEKQKQLVSRRNVIRKTAELKEKHAALETAIISRDFIAISRLLDDGAFADYETSGGAMSALLAACVEEIYVENEDGTDVLAVEYLLDRTMNRPLVNFESSQGLTALGTAAFYGTLKCAQVLIERGASINFAARLNGRTAVMVAAENGKEDFVRFLLSSKGIDVFLPDTKGKTALDYARTSGFVKIVGLLEAAMGGKRDRVVSTVSGLYGVCKWGCGFMTQIEGHLVHQARVVKNTNPLEEHELHHCLKRHVICPNHCGISELWAEEVNNHIQHTCELRLVNCSNQKCTVRYPFKDRTNHLQDECEFRVVVCECGESMSYQRHVLHAKTQCPMRRVPCPLQCQKAEDAESQVFQLRWQDVKVHVTGDCPHRNVRCRNGCPINDLLLKGRTRHETIVCLLRRVECKWGCNETVLANTQAIHERDECEQRQQSCPNRCGRNNVPVLEMDEHISTKCSRRLVPCSLGCGRRVPLHTMDAHVAQDCRKRTITCGQCHQLVLEEDRMTHQNSQCPHRLTVCGLCGQTNLSHTQMAHHRNEECKMRQVTCKYQCFVKMLVAHEKERHEMWECAFRPTWCPLGCGEVFICNALKKHQRSCPMRFVVCGNGCGEELREKDRADHEQHYCSLNKAPGQIARKM